MVKCCHMMMKKLIQAEEGEREGVAGVKVDRQETEGSEIFKKGIKEKRDGKNKTNM